MDTKEQRWEVNVYLPSPNCSISYASVTLYLTVKMHRSRLILEVHTAQGKYVTTRASVATELELRKFKAIVLQCESENFAFLKFFQYFFKKLKI